MRLLLKVGLLSVSLLVTTAGAITANLPSIIAEYPQINSVMIEFMMTMPSLLTILTVLYSHRLAKIVGYKSLVIFGIVLLLVAGVLPYYFHSIWLLALSRVLFGVGIGLFHPLLFSFATTFFEGDELAKVIGLQSACEGLGGMFSTFIVGLLLVNGWRNSFFVHLLAIPVLVLFMIFVPRIQVKDKPVMKHKTADQSSSPIWRQVLLVVVAMSLYMVVGVKMTAILMEKGYGSATSSSNLLALIGLGAMAAGLLFSKVTLTTKKWTIPISLLSLSLGMLLFAYSSNLLTDGVAVILCGFSARTFFPFLMNQVNQNDDGNKERNTSLLLIGNNIAIAFAPIKIAALQAINPLDGNVGLLISGALILIVIAAMSAIKIYLKASLSTSTEIN